MVTITQVFGLLTTILGYISAIFGLVGTAAQETSKLIIQTTVANIANTVNSPTFGNAALLARINDAIDQQIADTASLTLQIVNLTDGTTPVSLPVTAPSGYGGLDASATSSAVWDDTAHFVGYNAYHWMQAAGNAGAYLANWWENDNIGRYFQPVFLHIQYVFTVSDDLPVFDPSDILSTEDLKSCLIRQNPSFTVDWTYAPGGTCYLVGSFGADQEDWVTTIDGTYFNQIKAGLIPVSSGNAPPVWPGIGNVVLGTPVSIATSMTVSGPLDGLLIAISSVSPSKPALAYGGETAYKFIGALAFVSDNGDVEPFQPLSFQTAVYCPRQMKQADAVVLRVDPSVSGTVTPWVIA